MLWLLLACSPADSPPDRPPEPEPWIAPDNDWGGAGPPADLEAEGCEVGQVFPDSRLIDQHGDEVSLWQFYGDVVLLGVTTVWVIPSFGLGPEIEPLWQEHRDEGLVVATVLQENLDGLPADVEDIGVWAELFGITAPVLADGEKTVAGCGVMPGTYPWVVLLDRELRVIEYPDPSDPALGQAVERAL